MDKLLLPLDSTDFDRSLDDIEDDNENEEGATNNASKVQKYSIEPKDSKH